MLGGFLEIHFGCGHSGVDVLEVLSFGYCVSCYFLHHRHKQFNLVYSFLQDFLEVVDNVVVGGFHLLFEMFQFSLCDCAGVIAVHLSVAEHLESEFMRLF